MRSTLLLIFLLLQGMVCYSQTTPSTSAIEAPVKLQLKGYNTRDIKTFAKAFSDSVKVYRQPGVLTYQGKEELKKRYGAMFASTPDLHCKVVKRIIVEDVVIDHEKVQRKKGQARKDAIAVYRIKNGEIIEVTFIPLDKN